MTELLLLIIIILLLCYLIYFLKKQVDEKSSEETKSSYIKVLPEYINKNCEIILNTPLAGIDIMFSVKGVLIDLDDEWAMIEVPAKKKSSIKLFRIDNINSIKEIK